MILLPILLHCGYQEPEWLTKDLGSHWMMMDMLLVKHWPANVFVQTYAELAYQTGYQECAFDPDQHSRRLLSGRPLPSGTGSSETGYDSVTQATVLLSLTGVACAMYHPEPGAVVVPARDHEGPPRLWR